MNKINKRKPLGRLYNENKKPIDRPEKSYKNCNLKTHQKIADPIFKFDPKIGVLKTGGTAIPIIPQQKKDGTVESYEEAAKRIDYEVTKLEIESILHPDNIKALKEWADTGAKSEDEIIALRKKLMLTPESKVSDEEFFKYIREDPIFLGSRFAQDKIRRWQREMHSGDNKMKRRAQDNLKRIGTELALSGYNRQSLPYELIALERKRIYEIIKGERILKSRSDGYKRHKLEEIFGSEIIKEDVIPNTYNELADLITARLYRCEPSTVKQYRKKIKQIELSKNLPIFIPKEPIKCK